MSRSLFVHASLVGYVLTLLAVGYSDSLRSSHQASTLGQLTNSGATIMPEGGMVHPGDRLILVLDAPRRGKSPQKIVVDKNGYLTLPYDVKVQAQGKTLRQLEHEIRAKYVPRIFKRATATLTRDE